MNNERCVNCKFFLSHDTNATTWNFGGCRRYPPDSRDQFPSVSKNSWCGEYQKVQDSQ